jgi:flavin-dependent dehydrogenase
VYKPGATFVFSPESNLSFRFAEALGAKVDYSYNVPRDRFDASLLDAARGSGARVVEATARVERAGENRVRLAPESLEAAGLTAEPDWIIDASGRLRLFARLLDLPSLAGPRRDVALHAHLANVPLLVEGNVHTDRLERGWGWRIPLPGRVSLGLVLPPDFAAKFGDSAEQQFDNYLKHDPELRDWAVSAERITPVVKYDNYQLATTRAAGANWALVGDAFGFVDPVFSSGMLIGLEAARELSGALLRGSPRALARYERSVLRKLLTWQRIAGYFYNGRLFTLFRVGEYLRHTIPGRLLDRHFQRHMPRVFTGEATQSRYSTGLLHFMASYALAGNDPTELAIR